MVKTLSDGPEQSKEGDNGGGSRRRMRQVTDKGWQVLVHKHNMRDTRVFHVEYRALSQRTRGLYEKGHTKSSSHIG